MAATSAARVRPDSSKNENCLPDTTSVLRKKKDVVVQVVNELKIAASVYLQAGETLNSLDNHSVQRGQRPMGGGSRDELRLPTKLRRHRRRSERIKRRCVIIFWWKKKSRRESRVTDGPLLGRFNPPLLQSADRHRMPRTSSVQVRNSPLSRSGRKK